MTEPTGTINGLRDRLTGLLADWGAELAVVLKELEEKRARIAELEGSVAGRHDELKALQQRIEGQNNLIEALRGDAEEASKLRTEVRNRDLELERVNSELERVNPELESKRELVRALRRDADGGERFKTELRQKDRDLEDLKTKLQRAERQVNESTVQLAALREAAASRKNEAESELETLRSELEARKTMIKSLRADQDRATVLQATLEEKRDVIEQLEASINRHSNTIAELRRSADTWKRKYQAVKGDSPTATTSVSLPSLSDTDVSVIEQLEKTGTKVDATIAIDMRRSLLEARRTAAQGSGEK